MSLENLIIQLTSPDNHVRGEAERVFMEATANPEMLLSQLLTAVKSGSNPSIKSMAAILFRRYAFQDQKQLWNSCSPQCQGQLKAMLLQCLAEEENRDVRQKISHCIASTGKFVEGNWPELLPFMFECCNSPNENLKEAALDIFSNMPNIFGANLPRYIGVLRDVFLKSLVEAGQKVRLAALSATTAFLVEIEDPQQRNFFAELLNPMLQVIAGALNNQDEDAARDAIGSFVELAETSPTLLRHSLEHLVPAMSQIVSSTSVEDTTRHSALELLVTLSEQAPGMIRKFKSFVSTVYPAAWSLMVDLDDDTEWHTTDAIDNDEMDANHIVGEQGIDRIACALGGKTVLPYAFSVLPGMLKNGDWKHRYAALMTISAIGEGCHKVMEKELDKIIGMLVPLLNDPHPRVRYALCNALGQMSTDFAPTIQNKFHQAILPVFLTAMENRGNPRVQAHGAAALVNFCEEASKQILMPYLDSILTRLLMLIRNPEKRYIIEQCVTTLATVADSAEERFLQYYDTFMPTLIEVLENTNTKDLRLLRGKTMECISLIGLAVGKEKFMNDAKRVMDLLLQSQANSMEADDPQVSYMLSSWARIGAVLGEDFIPFLPLVMPPLLRSATLKPDVVFGADDNLDAYDPADGWEVLEVDDQKICIKTSIIDEKCTAVEMLYCYAKELKAGFHQYAPQVLEIVIPLLKFYFDDGVRSAAATTIAPVIKSLQLANYDAQYIANIWGAAIDPFLDVIQSEVEADISFKFIEGFYTCVDTMGDNCLGPNHLSKFAEAMKSQIENAIEREQTRNARRTEEDYDEEEEESLRNEDENDEYVLREISDAFHSVFKTHKEQFLPFFEGITSTVALLLESKMVGQKQLGLSILDDLVEFTGPYSTKYSSTIISSLRAGLQHQVPEIRQVCAYGAGVCAKNGGPEYAAACAEFVPLLLQIVMTEGARDEDNIHATENAISALAKIVEFNSSKTDANQLLSHWFSFMPILVDTVEATYCCDFLCRLIEGNHPVIMGQDNSNLPKIFSIFAEVIATEALEDEEQLVARMGALLKHLEAHVPESARPRLWEHVPEAYRMRLAEIFK